MDYTHSFELLTRISRFVRRQPNYCDWLSSNGCLKEDGTINPATSKYMQRSFISVFVIAFLFVCIPDTSFSAPKAPPEKLINGDIAKTAQFPIMVPFDLWHGLIVFQATVADTPSQLAILSTGQTENLLSNSLADTLKMTLPGTETLHVLDQDVIVKKASPQSLTLSKTTITNSPFGAFDMIGYLSKQKPTDAPALWVSLFALGSPVIGIDPPAHIISIYSSQTPLPAKSTIVPFIWKDGRMWVNVRVNGKESFPAVIDTGTAGILLPEKAALKLHLKDIDTGEVEDPSGKVYMMHDVMLQDLMIGKEHTMDVSAHYLTGNNPKSTGKPYGILGTDFLLRYKIVFQLDKRQIALQSFIAGQPENTVPTGMPFKP
jgi:hypothetical protein